MRMQWTATARMLRSDLAAARKHWIGLAGNDVEQQWRQEGDFLVYKNSDGEVVDFHATRHTYISEIVASGASVKTAQTLARHSTPVLTIGRYAHTNRQEMKGALDKMPSLDGESEYRKDTVPHSTAGEYHSSAGTVEGGVPANRQQLPAKGQQLPGPSGRDVANPGEAKESCATSSKPKRKKTEVVSRTRDGKEKPRLTRRGERAEGTGLEPATGFPAPHFQ